MQKENKVKELLAKGISITCIMRTQGLTVAEVINITKYDQQIPTRNKSQIQRRQPNKRGRNKYGKVAK